jgi:hypothetical protein
MFFELFAGQNKSGNVLTPLPLSKHSQAIQRFNNRAA